VLKEDVLFFGFDDHLCLQKKLKFVETMTIVGIFLNYMGKIVRAGAGIFDKLEPEPHKNGPAPQHCKCVQFCRR
jgi:hypothetical protein